MADGLQAQVKKDTRGVLLSRMGGVPLDKFNRDYQELLGNRFPYRDLGFNDLRSCLESMDDTVRFEFTNEKWMLFGIADDHSFMSSPAIKAQFTPDKPINQRTRKRRNGKKKSSDSDDSTGQHRSKKSSSAGRNSTPRPAVNGESSKGCALVPNLKGLYSLCVQHLPSHRTQEVIQLFREVASQEEESRTSAHLFLRYSSCEEASDIMAKFNGYRLGDMHLCVIPAHEKTTRGWTDKKSQSSAPREDRKNAFYSFSKEKQEAKLPKEEATVRVSLGNEASSRAPSNGTERQNSRQHRGKRDFANRTETNSTSARGDSCQEEITTQLPWNKPQVINDDVLGASNNTPIMREKPETDSKRLTREGPVQSPAPVNAFSNRNISKPSLPSILDIAYRLNLTKI
ncbi:uncharacterized protein [Asterias amurensis]|uniref:uncharacterized protein n=1 Tax=Asterias amurensis TaxID=7602 RepID=UPI003AB4C370